MPTSGKKRGSSTRSTTRSVTTWTSSRDTSQTYGTEWQGAAPPPPPPAGGGGPPPRGARWARQSPPTWAGGRRCRRVARRGAGRGGGRAAQDGGHGGDHQTPGHERPPPGERETGHGGPRPPCESAYTDSRGRDKRSST